MDNIRKQELRQYFSDTFSLPIRNIRDTYYALGVNNADDAYKILDKEFNKFNTFVTATEKKDRLQQVKKNAQAKVKDQLQKIAEAVKQKGERKQMARLASEAKKKISVKTFELNDSKFKAYVMKWSEKNNTTKLDYVGLKKFQITLKSTKVNVSKTFKFNSLFHFENWLEKVNTPEGTTYEHSANYVDDNIFSGDVIIDDIRLIKGGCNKHTKLDKKLKTSFYEFSLHNPTSMNNNCLFACLSHLMQFQVNTKELRKQFNLPTGSEISIDDAYKIIHNFNKDYKIIDSECNDELDSDETYLLNHNNHYYVVEKFTSINRKSIKTKRGLLAFDFETRPTEEYHLIKASNTKSFILKDTICCLYYKNYKSDDFKEVTLVTDENKTSSRKFIDWLNEEAKQNRSYNILAHNGGKFDFYFFIASLTDKELLECDIQMRGITIIGINYRGNLFKDSCCFLTDSLSNLSKSFKVEHGKICSMTLDNKEISSSQLCFYKPELTFNQFLDLQHTNCEFWKLYVKYCMHDCIALYEIWNKFTECVNGLIEKINPYLLRSCPLMSSSTIGSHSKKILVELNKCKGKANYLKQGIEEFTGVYYEEERNEKPMSADQEWSVNNGKLARSLFYRNVKKVDKQKYEFLCKFKRGGISHCHQAGKHLSGITGVDIASQYPASLLYSYIPTGHSWWVNKYDETKHGFYWLKNVKFNSYSLKPVAMTTMTSLNWASNDMTELYTDSYTLKYIIENYGLESFDVVEGLVSSKDVLAEKLFGKYINTFYEEKKQQDKYKTEKNILYNEALRSTIKLYLNSLTGKLVENPSIHFTMKFDETSTKLLNGQGVTKTFNEENFNDWLVPGLMVYSYSKRLLFEYIKCLPDNSNDVIHIETDGIYFSTRHLEAFTNNLKDYDGEYPCMFGEDLGNLKIEKTTYEGQVAYFLGKKFYCITMEENKDICRVKGIPQATIDAEGNKVALVDIKLYDDVYNGNKVTKTFQTLKKSLFTKQTTISTHSITRTIKPNCEYKLFL